MKSWDVKAVVQAYVAAINGRGNRGTLSNPDLNRLKVEVLGDPIWIDDPTRPTKAIKGPVSQVTVTRRSDLEVFGNVSTTDQDQLSSRVDILTGMVKGLNKPLRLPVKPLVPLGHVEIDLSKESSEHTDQFKVELTSGQEIPPGAMAATANVYRTTEEYAGTFKCKVALTGPVFFTRSDGARSEQIIAEIVRDHNVHSGLCVNGKSVTWDVEGHCEFVWKNKKSIEWQ